MDSETVRRRAEVEAELRTSSMYDLLGGERGVRAIVDRFFDLMDSDESFRRIRAMHRADLGPMRLSLFEFLSGWLGGPPLYVERHGSPCLQEAHAPYPIDRETRDLWLECMKRAMTDVGVAERYLELLMPAFAGVADMMRNDHLTNGE